MIAMQKYLLNKKCFKVLAVNCLTVYIPAGTPIASRHSNKYTIKMDTLLTIVYVLAFIVIFWLFFKSVNYFEKI